MTSSIEPVTSAQPAKCSGYVLIAEDERITAADLHLSLRQLGCCVVASVASGEEAVARTGELRPDIVIMDVRLRGAMDGLEAGRQISEYWGTPVIYVSAFHDADIRERAHQSAIVCLPKPFDPQALRSAVEKVLAVQSGSHGCPDPRR